ncbi:ATP-binding cassette domain-containing protein [Sorangium atrum]|uniref:ATP-binding cassette domain-containing protein n=1 Tax=Sorangium atrum TaxID=2995308 RepID=A0ABT5CGJ7_9BACT|nr:ATP-binding cassette domain-containing protein [Sorangium aterium]MDC0685546.1 ATP-binding cassette domain-containing protein [Sorangium aterium]
MSQGTAGADRRSSPRSAPERAASADPRRRPPSPRRRLLAPEVVQTSAMDCGPATLKCVLEGFGVGVSYGRLREACQTDVDGTSIDTLEDLAEQLGLVAQQILVPPEHVLLDEAQALPALAIVRQSTGPLHIVVIWRRHGGLAQIMDPGTGRRWVTRRQLEAELYQHELPLSAADFRAWAASDGFTRPLGRRLAWLGAGRGPIEAALSDRDWRAIAALDAGARLVTSLVRSGGLGRGREAARVLGALLDRDAGAAREEMIPPGFWTARPGPAGLRGEEQVLTRGAVLVRIRGRRPLSLAHAPAGRDGAPGAGAPEPPANAEAGAPGEVAARGEGRLPPDLAAALAEREIPPGRALLRMIREDGLLTPAVLAGALLLSVATVVLESLLFRGLLQISNDLALFEQRLAAIVALAAFLVVELALDLSLTTGMIRLGRHLEVRLRMAFLAKIPRIGDRYFQSRPASDMAQRGHSLHVLRGLPAFGGQIARSALDLAVTTAAIVWIDPASARLAVPGAALALALPFAGNRVLVERDLRVRTHAGALTGFYLDALLGLVPIRAHAAERAVRREHAGLLGEWALAGRALLRAALAVDGAQALIGFALAAWILGDFLARGGALSRALLLFYWALALPAIGQALASTLLQYPGHRNTALRLLEPLGAPEEPRAGAQVRAPAAAAPLAQGGAGGAGCAITFERVRIQAAGHVILDGVDLTIAAGSHVAIVGSSGAGKSSLVGVLLGWHRASEGRVLVDGRPLDGERVRALREETAWVDPAVQIWNRSFLDNLRYGAPDDAADFGAVVEEAELREVLERLPEGQKTLLGEGGGLVSGGEGQRLRLGRAMLRSEARLAILDEPFRGLDRERRRALLARARRRFRRATLLCVTHDVGETRSFERVLVVDGGRVVEDGAPAELAARPGSRYRALLEAEAAVQRGLWSSGGWRRLRVARGRIAEAAGEDAGAVGEEAGATREGGGAPAEGGGAPAEGGGAPAEGGGAPAEGRRR